MTTSGPGAPEDVPMDATAAREPDRTPDRTAGDGSPPGDALLSERPRRFTGVLAALDRPLAVGFITTIGVLGATRRA